MSINRLYAYLIHHASFLHALRQVLQRQTTPQPPQQKHVPADQTMTRLYALALAVVEQHGLD